MCANVLAVIGAADLTIASASGFSVVFLEALGLISLAAAVGVWFRRPWGLWIGAASAMLTLTAGLVTLYASALSLGLPTDLNSLTLYVGLFVYTLAALATLLYLPAHRSAFKPGSS